MKHDLDVLIVARPDHSMKIYSEMLNQTDLSYKYLTYKVFPKWLKRMTRSRKMVALEKNVICSWKLTVINLCRFKFKFAFAQNWDETTAFDNKLKHLFAKYDIKIIHYWPEYGDEVILDYVSIHPDSIAFADIHMPHPKVVYQSMKPVYLQHGISPESTQLAVMAKEQCDFASRATNFLVPSSYVADTYREMYAGKNFHVISYGISVSPFYSKKHCERVKEFVYAGRISLEKGCDLLLDAFLRHPNLTINLFGCVSEGQESAFEKYKGVPNIKFHGSVPKVELQEHLKKYDVGIHLSRFDAYSLAVGEMIGAGLPVIVSTCTGIKDDVSQFGFGEVTELNEEQIDETLERLCDPQTYNEYVDNIDEYIKHNNLSYGEKMLSFYQEVIRDLGL